MKSANATSVLCCHQSAWNDKWNRQPDLTCRPEAARRRDALGAARRRDASRAVMVDRWRHGRRREVLARQEVTPGATDFHLKQGFFVWFRSLCFLGLVLDDSINLIKLSTLHNGQRRPLAAKKLSFWNKDKSTIFSTILQVWSFEMMTNYISRSFLH